MPKEIEAGPYSDFLQAANNLRALLIADPDPIYCYDDWQKALGDCAHYLGVYALTEINKRFDVIYERRDAIRDFKYTPPKTILCEERADNEESN